MRALAVSLGALILAGAAAAGAGPALAQAAPACAPGSGAPCQQAFFQISKTTGAVTAAVSLPGANVEGQDYDGVVCQGAGPGKCFVAADRGGFLLMTFSSFVCNPTTAVTPLGLTAAFTIDTMAFDPATSKLYASVGAQLNVVDQATGTLTPTSAWLGHAAGADGTVEVDQLSALTFDPATRDLFGVVPQGARPSLLVRIDPATGEIVPGSFGAGLDYVAIVPDGGRTEVPGIAVVGGTMYATMSLYDSSPRLATIDMATGASHDIGAQGVPSVGGLTADSAGNLYGVSGTGGAVIGALPCPAPAPPAPPAQAAPVVVATSPAGAVLGVQEVKDPAKPGLPFTGFNSIPVAIIALACWLLGAAAMLAERRLAAKDRAEAAAAVTTADGEDQ